MNTGVVNSAISGVGIFSNSRSSISNTGSFASSRAFTSLGNNYNGLYGSYNGYGYGGGYGQGYGAGRLSYGGLGSNNTGFLVAAILIPAIVDFVGTLLGAFCNQNSQESYFNNGRSFNSFDNYYNDYDTYDAEQSFDNGINIDSYGYF